LGTDARTHAKYFIGPEGQHLTLADLPSPDTKRWVSRRKAEVVMAVDSGLLSFSEACARYNLSPEEFMVWGNSLHRYGLAGLRITQAQRYRQGNSEN
jgi:hypothetical protein